ncbi:hypothetical protein GQ457_05G027620 [Hibiscus cannabinus]
MLEKRHEPYVDECYKKTNQQEIYSQMMNLVRGLNQWVKQDSCLLILPRVLRKPPFYSGGLSRDLDVNSMEIKDSSASCHQEIKSLISPVKIQDWRFLRLTEEQGFSIPKFVNWFEKVYGSRSS